MVRNGNARPAADVLTGAVQKRGRTSGSPPVGTDHPRRGVSVQPCTISKRAAKVLARRVLAVREVFLRTARRTAGALAAPRTAPYEVDRDRAGDPGRGRTIGVRPRA